MQHYARPRASARLAGKPILYSRSTRRRQRVVAREQLRAWTPPASVERRSLSPTFWLGVHQPAWLARAGVPLMLSYRRLRGRRRLPAAAAPWVLDSGAFTELRAHGSWTVSAAEYAHDVDRLAAEVGQLAWAAPMDWTCDAPSTAASGLHVDDHVERTVASYLELTAIAPHLPWIPVLQGWSLAHYDRCIALYEQAGVDLRAAPVVGLGTLKGRAPLRLSMLTQRYCLDGLQLHAFGLSAAELRWCSTFVLSADSMAWSAAARYEPPLPGHTHRSCSSCLAYALAWRETVPPLGADVPRTEQEARRDAAS